MSRKAGKGSHGSLTKAGKVRSGTIKVERTSKQKKNGPRMQNRRKYKNRILLNRSCQEDMERLKKRKNGI